MISVLVVNHNGGRWLPRCLASVRATVEAGTELEAVLVDNASTDGSVERVLRDHPEVFVEVLEENVGFGAANNRAARIARGDRLLLLNPDAWLTDGALPRLDAALESDPRTGLVAPQLTGRDGRLQTGWRPTYGVLGEAIQLLRNRLEGRPFNHHVLPRLLRPLAGRGWYSAACVLLRRSAWDEVGGFDERFFLYFEDVDLCARLLRAGWRLTAANDATVVHVGAASRDPARHDVRYRAAQLTYYDTHRPGWERKLLRRRLKRQLRRMPDGEGKEALGALLADKSTG